MANERSSTSRRDAIKTLALMGSAAAMGQAHAAPAVEPRASFREELDALIQRTPFIDTHEHLPDEPERLNSRDDWAILFSHYIDSDLVSAGMTDADRGKFLGRDLDPLAKWKLFAPFWPAVKNTAYGQASRIAIRQLYGIDELDEKSIPRLQDAYEKLRRPGFYRTILVEQANIESCQVNMGFPLQQSKDPTLLMPDLSIVPMHMGTDLKLAEPAGIKVTALADWHAVIRFWFDKYAPYVTAVKSQAAYSRGLDFEQVPPEQAEPIFRKVLQKDAVSADERKLLQDHLFWYAVEQATKHHLPVKLHTGYYAGQNSMPLGRVAGNAAQAADLCRKSRDTQWVFMHICYPYWQDIIAVAKHYTNAHIDMCWAWIMDPVASTEFVKSYLLAAPANKLLTFGGDYRPVECVLGHAVIARQGLTRALAQLVDEGYLPSKDALELVPGLMHGNARRIFDVKTKAERLRKAPWL